MHDQAQGNRPAAGTSPLTGWAKRLATADAGLHVHLLGIGGTGLHPIALVLHQLGVRVSGSDAASNVRTRHLQALGIQIFPAQLAANLEEMPAPPDVVLISSAVGEDNPERAAAERMGLAVVKRREFLTPLLAARQVIAVAGSHGKSTTAGMVVHMLQECGIDAGYIVGSSLAGFGNAGAGNSPWFVIEADEYDFMFLGLRPTLAVVTNVEWDHPDCFPTPQSFHEAFQAFVGQTQAGGCVIACTDDAGAAALRRHLPAQVDWLSYGTSAASDLRARSARPGTAGGFEAHISRDGRQIGLLALRIPGLHNLRNGLAALAVALRVGLPPERAASAIGSFAGVARRFQVKGEINGITVIDDYAHHPTEVRATLAAARARYPQSRIWAVFQPHTFSRTRLLLHEMAASFVDADSVLVTDIYAAREQDDGTVSAADLVAASHHPNIRHIGELESAAHWLTENARPGDVVITLGAGTSERIGALLLEQLKTTQNAPP